MSKIITIEYGSSDVSVCPPSVIGLGLFDGVHLGHRALISEVVRLAEELSLTPAIFTFHSNSRGLKSGMERIYSDREKLRLFEELGIKLVYTADFSSLAGQSPEEFVENVLVKDLRCVTAVSGFNFRFGNRAAGDAAALSHLMEAAGGRAVIIDDERLGGETVSSTRIRAALAEGNAEEAADLLGSPYLVSGEVKHGRGLGQSWGFPTVNTEVRSDIPLKSGVYATRVAADGKIYTGVSNLGVCPSFGERELHLETMILDFNGNLYGKTVDVYFISYIRGEKSFSSPEELLERIKKDAGLARERTEKSKWQVLGQR